MFSWVTLSHLALWSGGDRAGAWRDFPVTTINTDTRAIRAGDVFLALKGDSFDGNNFLEEAVKKGAAAVITDRKVALSVPTLQVQDTLKALVAIGEGLRDKFSGKVVAVTGSAGKSSTKEMVATLLGANTVASPASFNNLWGVSRTLCLLEDTTRNLVLEMGMNALGEIAELCRHFKPQAGLITNIGDAHLGKLGGQKNIYRAKKELFDHIASLPQPMGIAVNVDDPLVMEAAKEAFPRGVKKITYSAVGKEAEVRVRSERVEPQTGFLSLEMEAQKQTFQAKLPIFGRHQAQNFAAALAMATLMGEPLEALKPRFEAIRPAYHRGEVLQLKGGQILVDESYNSNPTALYSSLSSLLDFDPSRRRVLVLGEMREMGDFGPDVHTQAGEKLVALHAQRPFPFVLIGVGKLMKHLVEAVRKGIPNVSSYLAEDEAEGRKLVREQMRPGDVILIKGSNGIKLERTVKALVEDAGWQSFDK